MKKFYFVFILLIIGALGLVYVFRVGWHPIALVNNKIVWAWQWEKEYQSALTYYNQAIDTYNIPGIDRQQVREVESDLKRASFERLIEKRIIAENFIALVGSGGRQMVNQKIDKYRENPKLAGAADALFNLKTDEFVDLILAPQAEKELIEENLKTENRDFNQWLKSRKHDANVYIFLRDYIWTGEALKTSD